MHAIDVSKGTMVGSVNAQWHNRSEDQRFTSLIALEAQVSKWAEESEAVIVSPRDMVATIDDNDPDLLRVAIGQKQVEPTHWSFGQLCSVASAPAAYLRTLPANIAAQNLNHGFWTSRKDEVMSYQRSPAVDSTYLRGLTSPKYGRILDRDVVASVRRFAGNGTGDTRWKVPGVIDWSNQFGVHYNPEVDITTENTTLYASDRDVFMFLVDDRNPIEVGKLKSGEPDLMFRGFYLWNSEVGAKTFGLATMYLRGVCQNRCLWGVEQFKQLTFRHTGGAPGRFIEQAEPALLQFAEGSDDRLRAGVTAAKEARVISFGASAVDKEYERISFLMGIGFTRKQALDVLQVCDLEDGEPPVSVWDFSQGISALARRERFQDDRLAMEQIAGRLLDQVVA